MGRSSRTDEEMLAVIPVNENHMDEYSTVCAVAQSVYQSFGDTFRYFLGRNVVIGSFTSMAGYRTERIMTASADIPFL